jgi:hypothetical protein
MIIIAIVAIISAIVIPNLEHARSFKSGSSAKWNGQIVRIVTYDFNTNPVTFIIRFPDNKEMRVTKDELSPVAEKN